MDKGADLWEIPTMAGVTKLDQRRRGIFPSVFRPGDMMQETEADEVSVRFRLIKRAEVPEVRPRKLGGRLYLPRMVDRSVIAAAVRAERDSR